MHGRVPRLSDNYLALPEMEWVKSLALGLLRRVPFSGASPS